MCISLHPLSLGTTSDWGSAKCSDMAGEWSWPRQQRKKGWRQANSWGRWGEGFQAKAHQWLQLHARILESVVIEGLVR